MKKQIIRTVSVLLMLVLLCLSMFSCVKFGQYPAEEYYPKGYTGGFYGIQPGEKVEFWWVETYAEACEGIEILKSHGSSFEKNALLTCDESLFDVKYCFIITGEQCYKQSREDNFFNRKLENVEVKSVIFLEDVSIDELVYSYIYSYDAYMLFQFNYKEELDYSSIFNSDSLRYELIENNADYNVYYDSNLMFSVCHFNDSSDRIVLSAEAMDLIIKSITVI